MKCQWAKRLCSWTMLAGLLAAPDASAGAEQRSGTTPVAQKPSTLPRFQRLWKREGLGQIEGAAAGRVYYTVSNDGRAVHAVDVKDGRSLWQAPLPEPAKEWARIRVINDMVVLAHQRGTSADAVITALSTRDGKVVWSRTVACAKPDARAGGSRFFLLCRANANQPPVTYHALDPATGRELARATVDKPAEVAPNGNLCGASDAVVWCGRIQGDRLDLLWSKPHGGSAWGDLALTSGHVIRAGDRQLVAYRATDGNIVWTRLGQYWVKPHETTDRLFAFGQDGGAEVVRLSDGKVLTKLSIASKGRANVLADREFVVVDPWEPGDRPVYLVDGRSRAQAVARNVAFISHVVGDVLLSQNVGMSGLNRANAPLEGYSLTRFAPSQDRLDPYQRAAAVLERHPFSYQATEALTALRSVPDAMASLEKLIATGAPELRSAAIAVAALTGDPRFVAPIRKQLDAITVPPGGVEQWSPIVDALQGLADLRSPEATVALLSFWRRMGTQLAPPWRRAFARDVVASSVWKFSAHKQWVGCDDVAFAAERTPPERASLGTRSPGVEYAVDRQRRWAAICEAREDDDRNGKLQVVVLHHGDTGGDLLRPYLVIGSGAGTEIDDFVDADPNGRWAVITKNMCVHLVDTQTGKGAVLKDADGRPGDAVGGGHRAASFSPDGKSLVYIKSDGARSWVVQRELRTGAERSIDPGSGELSRAFFERSGRFVVMDVLTADTDGDGRLAPPRLATTLMARRCRAQPMSFSVFGEIGDKPTQRIVAIAGGAVQDVPPGDRLEPVEPPSPLYELVSPTAGAFEEQLPIGPLRWKRRDPSARR